MAGGSVPNYGTRLLYADAAVLPGMNDLQSAFFDEPGTLPVRISIQFAEGITWIERACDLAKHGSHPPSA